MFNIYSKTKMFLDRHVWLGEVFVFALMFAVYFPLQGSKAFADPDSFYHLKLAELVAAQGPVRDFIWLPYTTLAQNFADHHFLYHVALIPFIKIFGSLAGMKLATAAMSAFAIAALAWALRHLGIRYAVVFAFMAGIMNPLVFRIGLSKASAAGVALLLIGTTFAIRRKSLALGIVAFLSVWTHGSWPALLGLGSLAIVIMSFRRSDKNTVIARSESERTTRQSQENFTIGALFMGLLRYARNDGVKSATALWLGAFFGLVVNPFFPANLKFYWEQIVQIAVINYQDKIGVGAEWYPYAPQNLIIGLPLLAIMAVVALVVFPLVVSRVSDSRSREQTRIALSLTVGAFIFLLLTLRSQRHVEYFVPLTVTSCAAWISGMHVADFGTKAKRNFVALFLVICGALAMIGSYAGVGMEKAKRDLSGSYNFTLYKKAAEYLKAHAEVGEIIVHADWDDMPSLFYWNDKNRYIMGLDPTFMYSASPGRYWNYVNFTLGKSTDPVAVMKELDSRYVFSDRAHSDLDRMLEKTGKFERVYIDAEAEIYLLK